MKYYITYTCRNDKGAVVAQHDALDELFDSWSEARDAMEQHLEEFNSSCTIGVWRGIIKHLS